MCNVHFIYPLGGKITEEDIITMKRLLEKASETNKDSYGVSDGVKAVSFKGTYDEKEAASFDNFAGSDFIIGHNRIATQGETQQPIIHREIALAHNGILTDYTKEKSEKKSDTLLWLENFVEFSKGKDFEESLKKFLGKTRGSYSMVLSYRNVLYYARNYSETFFMSLVEMSCGRMVIIGSSKFENIDRALSEWKYGFRISEIRGKIIRSIKPVSFELFKFDKEKGKVYCGEIDEPKYNLSSYVGEWGSSYQGVTLIDNREKSPKNNAVTSEYYGDVFKNFPTDYYERWEQ